MDRTYTTAGDQEPILLNIDNIQQQLHIQTFWVDGGAGTYSLLGNLGKIDTTESPGAFPVRQGYIVPDPDGWFEIQPSGAVGVNLGMDVLGWAIPLAFVKANISTLTSGSLKVKILQQSIL